MIFQDFNGTAVIDGKKIKEAKEEIYKDEFLFNGTEVIFNDEDEYKEEMYDSGQIKEAISLGAKWAINEFLKDLWHPVSEEPRRNTICLAQIGKYVFDTFYDSENWVSYSKGVNITRWQYVDDLIPKLKEGDER